MGVIDLRQASLFLSILNPNRSPLIFQTFDDSTKKDPILVTTRIGKLDKYKDVLANLNDKGAGVFVTVNVSRTNRRIKNDMISARAIWQEDDIGTDKIPKLEPSMVIETSAGKFHRYWLIKDGTENLKQWEKVQQKLVDDWDSDPNVKDTCRVMRIPGFYHKKKDPFQTRIVSDTDNVKYYEWSEIVEYFMPKEEKRNKSYSGEDEDRFDPINAIREVLDADNFHGALQSLAGRYANMNMGMNETVMLLKALIMSSSCTDSTRKERAFNEVEDQVKWAYLETDKENFVHPGLGDESTDNSDKTNEYLRLDFPPGIMGKISKNVLEFMRYPSREIAIETALHCVNVFGASTYSYDGVPNHRRTVILAGQGRGKNVVNTYIERVSSAMCHGNMANPIYLEFVGNGDYTSPKQMHLELQEFGSRSMISSEAGHMQATKAGDRVGIKGYENQTIMNDPYTLRRPPRRQNGVKGEEGMIPIQSICMSIVHESVLGNYAKLFADREAYNDGTISRTSFLFIDPIIDKTEKNTHNSTAQIDNEVLDTMKMIADRYIQEGDPVHKHTGMAKINEVLCEKKVDDMFDLLEDTYIDMKNSSDNEVETAIYARKLVLIKQTCKQLAIADNPKSPRVCVKHAKWAIKRSDMISANLVYHASQGGLSGAMPQLVVAAMDWFRRYLNSETNGRVKVTKTEMNNNTVHAKVFRRHFFDAQKRILAMLREENAFKYMDNSRLYNSFINELEQTNRIEPLINTDCFGNRYKTNKVARDFKVLANLDGRLKGMQRKGYKRSGHKK